MQHYEKLGTFYLGRSFDLSARKTVDDLVLYDSKDLVTHAVCVGMTGSGKTGLCLALLEEAAIDGIPAIIIDPKGDLANLLLTFPALRGEDFAPWVNEDDAAKTGLTVQDYANHQAALWKKGLDEWGQGPDRIQRLRDAADVVVYTPGSNAGLPVSILKSFAAPASPLLEDAEMLGDRISATVTSLLGLVGIDADPIQSREHILLSTILNWAWQQAKDLDLAAIIQYVQSPPVSKIGVLDLESFYPAKDRFGLVMAINNVLAAPGFSMWMEGDPLDIGQMLRSPIGKPQLAVFSIAHLNDAERMFFVSLLFNQVLGWARAQSGTTSLRAILYMDEIFGYLPPVANPPSKKPLLTLLKQARAFGLGVVLATQNPVDLDYKGLSNTGTWFIGRLQTERDKARVLDGLEGAAAGSGGRFDRRMMEQMLAGLGSRVFLMHNTHEDAPIIFRTRWTLSYLRGPLTRNQIKTLMDPIKAAGAGGVVTPLSALTATQAFSLPETGHRPTMPPGVSQFFIPIRGGLPAGSELLYRPVIFGAAKINFVDAKANVDVIEDVSFITPVTDEAVPVSWDNAQAVGLAVSDLEQSPVEPAQYADLPAAAAKVRSFAGWSKGFVTWLYGTQTLDLLFSPSVKSFSRPNEAEREFRARLSLAAHERRDDLVEKLRQKYAPKIAALQERIRKAQQAVEREADQAKQQQLQTALSFGAMLLSAVIGRKTLSTSTLGRVTTAARGVGRSMKERQDVGRAQESVEALEQQLAYLYAEFEAATAELKSTVDPVTESLSTVTIKPKKTQISVQLVSLVWAPYRRDAQGMAMLATTG